MFSHLFLYFFHKILNLPKTPKIYLIYYKKIGGFAMKKIIFTLFTLFVFSQSVYAIEVFPQNENEVNKEAYDLININEMWEEGYTGEGINVAILDTGLGYSENNNLHQEFNRSNIEPMIDCTFALSNCRTSEFEDSEKTNSHGTFIAGLIASQHNNFGMKGIAPNVNIFPIKIKNEELNPMNEEYMYDALQYIYEYNSQVSSEEDKIHIINISQSYPESTRITNTLRNLYYDQNVLIVAAGGNHGVGWDTTLNQVTYPANLDFVIGVANVNNDGSRFFGFDNPLVGSHTSEGGSLVGNGLEIAAPGVNLWSTITEQVKEDKHLGYYYMQNFGTSFSAPIVTGYLALLKEQFPNDTAQQLWDKIMVNTVPRPSDLNEGEIGYVEYGNGILQAVPYGKKFAVGTLQNTNFYTIPYDSVDYLVSDNIPSQNTLLDVYLEWNDVQTKTEGEQSIDWLKVKIEENTYYWVKQNEVIQGETVEDDPRKPIFRIDPDISKEINYMKNGFWEIERPRWYQNSFYATLNFGDIDARFDYHPNMKAYETLRSMQNGKFYDSELLTNEREELFSIKNTKFLLKEGGVHPYKGTSDYQRLDLLNQYNLAFEDAMGQTYFVPVWSHTPLEFDLVAQTIKPSSTDFVHVNGYFSEYSRLYGLKPTSEFSDLGPYYLSSETQIAIVQNDGNLLNHNFLTDIESYLGNTELTLVSY